MKKLISLFCMTLFIVSCTNEQIEPEAVEPIVDTQSVAVNGGVLAFDTLDALSNTVEQLKETDQFSIEVYSTTRSGSTEFTSLRQHLIDQGLREFTDAELAEIIADGLTYEPEDDLIVDPYLTAVLNQNREVQVGDKIYRYIDEGIIIYDAEFLGQFSEAWTANLDTNVEHGTNVPISDGVYYTKIAYNYTRGYDPDGDGWYDPIEPPYGNDEIDDDVYNNDGSITLKNGVTIPKNKIRRATYAQGNGDANWLQRTASGIWGTNVTLENNFNDRHRMKLRMFDQDYIIYHSVGMTVRMQKRTLGIWWRKAAQEFRYGWTAIESEYKFNSPVFPEPPKDANGLPQHSKYPAAMYKNFPYEDKDIVLFHIPIANYDVTSGDINRVMNAGMRLLANNISQWLSGDEGKGMKNNPRGLYTSLDSDRTIRVVYPRGEEVAYGEGREVVRWTLDWFSGNFIASFSNNLHGGGWITSIKNISPGNNTNIVRGRVYAAVKFDNEWRACIIETASPN